MARSVQEMMAMASAAVLAVLASGVVLVGGCAEEPVEEAAPVAEVPATPPPPPPAPGARTPPAAPTPVAAYTKSATDLEWFDIAVGEGASPVEGSVVVVEYTGWLEDGTSFDSSYKRPKPFSFAIAKGQVIPGWDEGVMGMKVGGKRQLKIPGKLGYGARGTPRIPPNSTLIFDVELLEVKAPRVAPAAPMDIPKGKHVKLPSGLQYYDIQEGTGATPKEGQTVMVDYTGWLENGEKFDSSLDRAEPIAFPVGTGRVIKGWDEGVGSMMVGGKRQLIIPYELAYGERGRPPVIPPKSTLIFDVELVGIEAQ